jgi:hypothetical protein
MLSFEKMITVSEIAEMPDTSFGSAYATLHDDLGYQKVCARGVPRQLTHTDSSIER